MPATTVKLQDIIDYSRTFGELTPVLGSAGYSTKPALNIARTVMSQILSKNFPWKWNRVLCPLIYTNGFQQDYATSQTGLAWLEHGFVVDIFNTSTPKPRYPIEVVRDLEETSNMFSRPGQAAWLPNNQLNYGTWTPATNILAPSARAQGSGGFAQFKDANGNLYVATVFGVTGAVAPSLAPNTAPGTNLLDGSVLWTAVDPYGQGFRLNPLPPSSGVVYEVHLIGQAAPPAFTSISQTLAPLPDNMVRYFEQGFIAQCYRHSPEPKVRAKFASEWALFMEALQEELHAGDRERDEVGFYPSSSVMSEPDYIDPGPAWPFGLSF